MPANRPPPVAADRFESCGLTLADRRERVVARVAGLEVHERTAVYEDAPLGRATSAALGRPDEGSWRFAFHSRLTFSPPLPRGIGPVAVWPILVREVANAFAADLRARGVRNLRREPGHRTRAADGRSLHLERFVGELNLPGGRETAVGVEGWIGLGRREGVYHVVGGAFPTGGLPGSVRIDPAAFRRELRELIRTVA